ncbi:MAG: AmiS/UreI family transporter [Desulfomonilaceae bacterium]|nr:AmiS/UreI family transporter [Desulfomonilaceae bacterium]
MTVAILIAISAMWTSVALFFLGKGEAKGTGAICGFVGATTVLGAFLQAAVFNDPFVAGLLFVHGLFYCAVGYALLAGLDDLRSVGNVSLNTAIVSVIYMIIFFTGGPVLEGGKQLVVKSNYLAFACAGYAALTFMVWLNANGKFPAGLLAWSLLVWVVLGLWVPAFYLMVGGALPF